MSDKNISSAELTAYWRSADPAMSHDALSRYLVSDAGIEKAHGFIKQFDYPLIEHKLVIRAGYFYEQALALLQTGRYDSCISLASGFSALTYLLAQEIKGIKSVDVDLSAILDERMQRIRQHPEVFKRDIQATIEHFSLDLENIAKEKLQKLLPQCKKPLFLIEGISYFLQKNTVTELLRQISSYDDCAIILDYWPEDSLEISKIFKRISASIPGFIPEDFSSFLTHDQISLLRNRFNHYTNLSIGEIDVKLSAQLKRQPLLIKPDEYFPIRIITAY